MTQAAEKHVEDLGVDGSGEALEEALKQKDLTFWERLRPTNAIKIMMPVFSLTPFGIAFNWLRKRRLTLPK